MLCQRTLQRVVVRSPEAAAFVGAADDEDYRTRCPTLTGLGERSPSPTIPDDGPPASGWVTRRRPVVLLDEVDDALAERYLREAARILATVAPWEHGDPCGDW